MGTRSLTKVIQAYSYKDEHGKEHKKNFVLMNMYRQMDGYPEGHGKELAHFLKDIHIANGLGANREKIANGAGCLAAQVVADFKDGPGGIYLEGINRKNCGQEYEYTVKVDEDKLTMEIEIYDLHYGKKIFSGTPSELLEMDFEKQREQMNNIRQRKKAKEKNQSIAR